MGQKPAMRTALRVLTAISERHDPDPTDAQELRQYTPLQADTPLDEVAFLVIQQAIKVRALARIAGEEAEA
jgi:hypothetical protein